MTRRSVSPLPPGACTATRLLAPALSLALVLALSLVAVPARAKVVDRIVATVNGEVITLFDLNQRMAPILTQMRQQKVPPQSEEAIKLLQGKVLDRMIDDILMVQEAEHYKITIADTEVDTYVNSIKERNQLTEESFAEYLKNQGQTVEEYKETIRRDILKHRIINYMVRRKVVITDEDIQRYYDEHKTDYMGQRTVTLSLIVLPPEEDTAKLLADLRSGTVAFEDAAQKHSIGPGAESGGSIGKLKWTSLAAEWKKALEGLKPGDVSEPFTLEGRQALLKLDDMDAGELKPVDQVREEIADKLREPLLDERYAEYMKKLKEKAVIDIRL
ncbi:MAG: SurA N-terminal domain-containing protein [Desulfovibrionaceae bacterium]|nr:SurA N-terminal domain-containing protein [Desulfovibrionaceae bacterium]